MYLSKPCHGKMTFPNLTFVWLYPHRPKNSAYFRCTCSVDRHVNYTWSPCRKLMITWLAIYIRIKESFFEDYEVIILVRPWSNPTKPEGLIDRFEMLMKCIGLYVTNLNRTYKAMNTTGYMAVLDKYILWLLNTLESLFGSPSYMYIYGCCWIVKL